MPSHLLNIQFLILLGVAAVSTSFLELLLGKGTLRRFIAHTLGATLMLIMMSSFLSPHPRIPLTLDSVTHYIRQKPSLLFISICAISTSVIEAVLMPRWILYFIAHILGLFLAAYLVGG